MNIRTFILCLGLWSLVCQTRAVDEGDFCVLPDEKSNFLEAAFRCALPGGLKNPDHFLVVISGTDTDARPAVSEADFQEIARVCNAAVIGVYFRGEGLTYDIPNGGSGAALEKAADFFAEKLKKPSLRKASLLLWGHSAGAQFAFNYTSWHPERVKAFAAIKAGGFSLEPQADSYRVPGLIAVGELDEVERIRNGTAAFLGSEGKDSSWCFLRERNSGHESGKSGKAALIFFRDACLDENRESLRASPETGERIENRNASRNPSGPLSWLPGPAFAQVWREIHLPETLEKLATAPDPVKLAGLVFLSPGPELFSCPAGETVSQKFQIKPREIEDAPILEANVTGDAFALAGKPVMGLAPGELTLEFRPGNLPWGPVKGTLRICGRNGETNLEPMEVPLAGLVKGPVQALPSMLYLGSAHSGGEMAKKFRLQSDSGPIRILAIRTQPSSELSVSILEGNKEGRGSGLQLEVHWKTTARLGTLHGEILIDFAQPEKGCLRIPVVGWNGFGKSLTADAEQLK